MAQKQKPTVVATKSRFSFSKRAKVVAACAVAVVAVAAVVLWWWAPWQTTPKAPTDEAAASEKLNKAVEDYLAAKDYKGAINYLKDHADKSDASAQQLLATTYANSGDYKSALSTYQSLDSDNSLTAGEAAGAGAIAERAGDYKTALRYYQEAYDKAKAEQNPDNSDDVHVYQAKVQEMQKKL